MVAQIESFHCLTARLVQNKDMEIPQSVLLNGKRYLEEQRAIMLAISFNNPHYYKKEVIQRLLCFAGSKSDKVRFDVIYLLQICFFIVKYIKMRNATNNSENVKKATTKGV